MDGERFDTLLREVATPTSRRRIVGGVLGGVAALVAGTAVIKAKPGNGHAKGKTKTRICHYQGTNEDGTPKYKALKLGTPGGENHLKHHELDAPYVDCCPGDTCPSKGECFTTVGCDTTGTCAYTVNEDAPCTIGGIPGTCAAVTGECIPNPIP